MLEGVNKILVAKLRHHGDVLLSAPLFLALKNHFPKAHIDAYIYKETLPMLEGHRSISNYILYDRKISKNSFISKIKQEFKLLRRVKKAKYDLVINLTEGDRGALAAFVSKAKYRIGFDPEKSGFFGKKKVYTHTTRICHGFRHTVERHLDILRCLKLPINEEDKTLEFVIPNNAYQSMKSKLEEAQINLKTFALVHPVSRWLFKCYDERKMAQAICYLQDQGLDIVFTGSNDPLEIAMNQRIKEKLSDRTNVLDLSGSISLKELGALIDLSQILLCVDSVPLHIASALKATVVALFGPSSEKTWAPWLNPFAIIVKEDSFPCRPCFMPGCGGSGKSDCLVSMPVSKITDALSKALQLKKRSQNSYAPKEEGLITLS